LIKLFPPDDERLSLETCRGGKINTLKKEKSASSWLKIHNSRIGLHENSRYSCQILKKPEFLYRFSKNSQIWSFIRIRPGAAELFETDGRTERQTGRQTDRLVDMTKLVVSFRKFANAPKMGRKGIEWVSVDWFYLAQDVDRLQGVVGTVMDFLSP
jgi:hypothetical protein